MPHTATIKPTHKAITEYYASLQSIAAQNVSHEMAVRRAFRELLATTAKLHDWTLIEELSAKASATGGTVRPDATYRLGNRSALDWIIDQYQLSTDKRTNITSDPNRADDPEYNLCLIAQIITVSLETMKIVNALPVEFAAATPANES